MRSLRNCVTIGTQFTKSTHSTNTTNILDSKTVNPLARLQQIIYSLLAGNRGIDLANRQRLALLVGRGLGSSSQFHHLRRTL